MQKKRISVIFSKHLIEKYTLIYHNIFTKSTAISNYYFSCFSIVIAHNMHGMQVKMHLTLKRVLF